MQRNLRFYTIIWLIILATFNAVVFLLRPLIPGIDENFGTRFWIAWIFIMLAFIGNYACAFFTFQEGSLKRVFYGLSLIAVCWIALVTMFLAGCILMLIPGMPTRVTVVVFIIILALNAINVVRAVYAAGTVERVDDLASAKTYVIKSLTVEAQRLSDRAKSEGVKGECQKVYDAFRYSDPVSNPALGEIENRIGEKLIEFGGAIDSDDETKVKIISADLQLLIGDRNKKCKELK